MSHIRQAGCTDLERIAEIEVFNYRLNFYPLFQNDAFYFRELRVSNRLKEYEAAGVWVYDDGVVKGFVQVDGHEVKKLFVEPVLQGHSIGAELLQYAIAERGARFLWALEKNIRAIAFYERHGFRRTNDRVREADTAEFLIRLER